MAFQGMNIAKLRQAFFENESIVGDISLTLPLPIPSALYPSTSEKKVPGSEDRRMILSALEVFSIPEITLNVIQFLNPTSLVNFEQVSTVIRNCEYYNYAWLELCKEKWALKLSELDNFHFNLVDTNYKILYFNSKPLLNSLSCRHRDLKLNGTKVSFKGRVGEENRSVRSVLPFPTVPSPHVTSYFSFLTIACVEDDVGRKKELGYFSSPFVNACPIPEIIVNIRSVAYFEIVLAKGFGKIRSNSNFQEFFGSYPQQGGGSVATSTTENVNLANDEQDESEYSLPEVVAVGLSSSRFLSNHRLPGWDFESYGYHGDDGNIFHGHGRQVGAYGPTFSVGDTIGCGINYKTKSIFFTLNGKFLGNAFEDVVGDWYPTVGIDSKCDVTFNFGRIPFQFDLLRYDHENSTMY